MNKRALGKIGEIIKNIFRINGKQESIVLDIEIKEQQQIRRRIRCYICQKQNPDKRLCEETKFMKRIKETQQKTQIKNDLFKKDYYILNFINQFEEFQNNFQMQQAQLQNRNYKDDRIVMVQGENILLLDIKANF